LAPALLPISGAHASFINNNSRRWPMGGGGGGDGILSRRPMSAVGVGSSLYVARIQVQLR
jgi:hypothetical protein